MKTFPGMLLMCAMLALPCPALAVQNILLYGDSLSAGYGIARDDSWANLLQQALKKTHPQYALVNASISGETAAGGLARIPQTLRTHHPAILILELGANDGLRGANIEDIAQNLDSIILLAQRAHTKVLLLGMALPPNYGADYTRRFSEIYPNLAHKHGIELLSFLLADIPPEQFQADNLHPEAAAQPHIMQRVLQALKPLLR